MDDLKTMMWSTQETGILKKKNAKMDSQLNELEQYGLRYNLESMVYQCQRRKQILKLKKMCCKFSKKLTQLLLYQR